MLAQNIQNPLRESFKKIKEILSLKSRSSSITPENTSIKFVNSKLDKKRKKLLKTKFTHRNRRSPG
jgi:hypothetical protein